MKADADGNVVAVVKLCDAGLQQRGIPIISPKASALMQLSEENIQEACAEGCSGLESEGSACLQYASLSGHSLQIPFQWKSTLFGCRT